MVKKLPTAIGEGQPVPELVTHGIVGREFVAPLRMQEMRISALYDLASQKY
jgi:hypothetical protein